MSECDIKTYCVDCDKEVAACTSRVTDELNVRGSQIRYEAITLSCPECGSQISDSRIEDENLHAAYAQYSKQHNIPLPAEITALRKKYGLSLREFSRFLGFGEQTIARYEKGALPDEIHAYALRQAQTADGARSLLSANHSKLTYNSIQKVERFIEDELGTETTYALINLPATLLEDKLPKKPCRMNGYRVFDFVRAATAAQLLASKCKNLYNTKFQKAMFYADMLACEKLGCSITGLQYAHGTHGPVINGKDELGWRLTGTNVLESTEDGWGDILTPGPNVARGYLSSDELAVIDRVAEFVNSFNTANGISEWSHDLAAWKSTDSGKPIAYNANHGEIEESIERRLSET